jgi:polar amino acid transport system substrate-binding protein
MKKAISLLLILFLAASVFAGCDVGSNAPTTTSDDTTVSEDVAVEVKTYTVGTDTTFAPFEFEDETGKHTGIDILLAEAIAEEMGFKIEWQVLGFSAAVTALESGQVDAVMAGMSITEERSLKYDFSDAYYDGGIGVAVSKDAAYTTIDDIQGTTVVAKTGTTGATYADQIAATYNLNVLLVDESAIMYTYLQSGQAVACFEDYPIIQYEIARGNIQAKVINTSDYTFPMGFATIKGTKPELVAAFNEGLAKVKSNGKYDQILKQFFGE